MSTRAAHSELSGCVPLGNELTASQVRKQNGFFAVLCVFIVVALSHHEGNVDGTTVDGCMLGNYLSLTAEGGARLVVMEGEVGGLWSVGARKFLGALDKEETHFPSLCFSL